MHAEMFADGENNVCNLLSNSVEKYYTQGESNKANCKMLTIEEFGWMAYRIIPLWGPFYTILTTFGISEIISKFTGATFKYSTWLPKK